MKECDKTEEPSLCLTNCLTSMPNEVDLSRYLEGYEDAEFRYDIPTEIGINELMVSRTGKSVFVLADHTKLLRRETKDNAYGSISYDSPITLITDAYADREIIKKLEEHGMRVLIAPEGA